ncbi:MAG: alpha/beta hydrolase domain-containing protein, partial [Planctomycetia bacterium]
MPRFVDGVFCFRSFLPLLLIAVVADGAAAGVVHFEVVERKPFAGGHAFGDVGPYERIAGRVYFAVDPKLQGNQAVVDLDLAPKNAAGRVEFSADFFMLAPADPTKGNGALLFDVDNRGNKLLLSFFNDRGGNDPATLEDAGNGFLFRQGYTCAWCGWDAELLPGGGRLRLKAPVAKQPDGKPIIARVRCEMMVDAPARRQSVTWPNHASYRPANYAPDDPSISARTATLTFRERPGDPRTPIPRAQWTLHVGEPVEPPDPSQLPFVEVELNDGFRPGWLYELIYEAVDPLVQGAGFAAVRDVIAAWRDGSGAGNPLAVAKPDGGLRSPVRRAYAFGVSQSGRFLREFLYSGFNQDEKGRKVFD